MSIDARCKKQRTTVNRMFMDYSYTAPDSKEQAWALTTLSFLVGMWADFLSAEEIRMDRAQALEANRLQGDDDQGACARSTPSSVGNNSYA